MEETSVKCDCGANIVKGNPDSEWNYSCLVCKQEFFDNEFNGMKEEQEKRADGM